jgi:hypothetical protein
MSVRTIANAWLNHGEAGRHVSLSEGSKPMAKLAQHFDGLAQTAVGVRVSR